MQEYHKIQSIFKRDEKTKKFIEGNFSLPEFEYLKDNQWIFTEKVNGTNIRVGWELDILTGRPEMVKFGGKTVNAQIPVFLYDRLDELFTKEKFKSVYLELPMTLYGEGYGARIQKGGGNYISAGVDFVLFDVLIGGWWLTRENMEDIALKLGIKVVPIIGEGTLGDAVNIAKAGFKSMWGDFTAEGIVMKPKVDLKTRAGHRIIAKVKSKDFNASTEQGKGER